MKSQKGMLIITLAVLFIATGIALFLFMNRQLESKETAAQVQANKEVSISIGETYESDGCSHTYIYPNNINDTFVIDILLPDNYDSSKTYPAVYLTDCYWRREDYPAMQELYRTGKTQEFILVGIGYPDDYNFDRIRNRDLIIAPHAFLKLIVEGIIPYVESNYSIDANNRSFLGASCGGYFMLYSLFQSDGLTKDVFKNYIVNSPVFIYFINIKQPLFSLEEDYFARNGNKLDAYVYVTVGGEESEEDYKQPLKELVETMQDRNYDGLVLEHEVYEDLGHYEVWVPTLLEGLSRCLAK